MSYGTLSIFDTLGSRRAAASDYLGLYDEQTLYEQVQRFLDAHNLLMSEMTADIMDTTTERFLTWGNIATVDMQEGDEFSIPDAQKAQPSPVMMGFPLKIKQAAYQVTQRFMQTKTLGDLEDVVKASTDADLRQRLKDIRAALFNPTNNTAYVDRFVDGANIPLRALTNADGTFIPPDRFGNTFNAGTHTHFLGTASFVAADLTALIQTVLEHYYSGDIRVYINQAQEAAVRAMSGFYAYWDARLNPGVNTARAIGELDMSNIYDRPIGVYNAAQIWVRPWVPASYLFCFNAGETKPLRMRTRPSAGIDLGQLRIAAQNMSYPLQATVMEREYGIGVYERTNGAVLYTGNATYTAPPAWSL